MCNTDLRLSHRSEDLIPVSSDALLTSVEDVVGSLGRSGFGLGLLLARRPDLLEVRNDPVAPDVSNI